MMDQTQCSYYNTYNSYDYSPLLPVPFTTTDPTTFNNNDTSIDDTVSHIMSNLSSAPDYSRENSIFMPRLIDLPSTKLVSNQA